LAITSAAINCLLAAGILTFYPDISDPWLLRS
jgi:hypothetical protein